MVKNMLVLTVAAMAMSSTAPAQRTANAAVVEGSTQQAEVKLTEVRFCPMMGHAVAGEGAGQRVYQNYKVYFC